MLAQPAIPISAAVKIETVLVLFVTKVPFHHPTKMTIGIAGAAFAITNMDAVVVYAVVTAIVLTSVVLPCAEQCPVVGMKDSASEPPSCVQV